MTNETMKDGERAAFEAWLSKEHPGLVIDYAPLMGFYKGDDGAQIGDMWDAWQARAASPQPFVIKEDARDGNWREFSVNGHGGFIRVVARMEDDDEDLPLGAQVAQWLLSGGARGEVDFSDGEARNAYYAGFKEGEASAAPQAALSDEQIREIAAKVTADMQAEAPGFRIISSDEFDLRFARTLLTQAPTERMSEATPDTKDAERYRYLRSRPMSVEPDRIDVVYWSALDESANEGEALRGDALDDAIDAAMKNGV